MKFHLLCFICVHLTFSREITGYLLMFRVFGLKTLRYLFPNLAVIRGEQLITHYALILNEMTQLTEVIEFKFNLIELIVHVVGLCYSLCSGSNFSIFN